MNFIPFNKPCIGNQEINEVVDTLKSGWLTTGPKTKKFEEEFKKYVNTKHAVAMNSCTAALHLALAAIGLKNGDEVITSTFTFGATAEVIAYFEAKPVFVDIKPDTYNIDSDKIEEKITKKTKAIIPVHYGGQPCDMDKIMKIAKKHKLAVIEDAAHAIGAEYKGKMIGSIGDMTCFSFYATKNLTTGEGGMLTTDNKKYAEKARILSLHGISKDAWKRYSKEGSWYYEIVEKGYKYNLTDMQSAIGLWQLKKNKRFTRIRKQIADDYTKQLKEIDAIVLPFVKTNIKHSWHLYQILIDLDKLKIDRARFIEELKKKNIGASVHFIPVHLHPYYRKTYRYKEGDFPVAERVYERIVSLPIYPSLMKKEVKYICDSIKDIVKKFEK